MGVKILSSQETVRIGFRSQTRAEKDTAQRAFAEMRNHVLRTRPWARNLMALAIQFPDEHLTSDERIEIACQTGERRLILNAQSHLLNNEQTRAENGKEGTT